MTNDDKALVDALRKFPTTVHSPQEAADRIEAQAAEIAHLRGALQAIMDGSMERPLGKSLFPDGRPSKHDQCIHGVSMNEYCEGCIDDFIDETLSELKDSIAGNHLE